MDETLDEPLEETNPLSQSNQWLSSQWLACSGNLNLKAADTPVAVVWEQQPSMLWQPEISDSPLATCSGLSQDCQTKAKVVSGNPQFGFPACHKCVQDQVDLEACTSSIHCSSQASLAEIFTASTCWPGHKVDEIQKVVEKPSIAGAESRNVFSTSISCAPVRLLDAHIASNSVTITSEVVHSGQESCSIFSVKIQEFIEATVEGPEQESLIMQHLPVFTLLQTAATLVLWTATFFIQEPGVKDGRIGLDAMRPGSTDLRIHTDCQDHRLELYRLFSYQFSHVDARHVLVNSFLCLFLGIPLEGFHGFLRTMATFNAGVFGGACCFFMFDIHTSVVGMSAGCYALMGMHSGDLVMNWAQRKYRRPLLLALMLAVALDVLNAQMLDPLSELRVSHSAHVGGCVAGFCCGILFGRNLVVKRWEQRLQVIIGLACAFLVVFTLSWGQAQSWPPRSIFEASAGTPGWCWSRQISNSTLFGDHGWHCVRCHSQACVDRWTAEKLMQQVSIPTCRQNGGWTFTEN